GVGTAEPPQRRGNVRQGIFAERGRIARRPQLQPIVMKVRRVDRRADDTERMKVTMPEARPVDELDAELEGAARLADEIVLVDAENLVEGAQRRDGRLAHAHRADLRGLDDFDGAVAALQQTRERRGRHPPRRSAAHDDDLAQAAVAGISRGLHGSCSQAAGDAALGPEGSWRPMKARWFGRDSARRLMAVFLYNMPCRRRCASTLSTKGS